MGERCLEPHPSVDDSGVPYCTSDGCHQYDGKRCRLIGSRPGNICEPAVIELARLAKQQTCTCYDDGVGPVYAAGCPRHRGSVRS